MKPFDPEDLANRFGYHNPTSPEIMEDHQNIRRACLGLANYIAEVVPTSRELATAITRLEEAMYWANAGIARIKNYQGERPAGQVPSTSDYIGSDQ